MQNPKFEYYQSSRNGQWYNRLKAANGEILVSSEGFTTKQSCLDNIEAVQRACQEIYLTTARPTARCLPIADPNI